MLRPARVTGALVLAALIAGCGSTSIRESWTAPNAGPIEFEKILVVFMDSNEGTRRAAKDQLVSLIQGADAAASYTLFTSSEVANAEANEAAIRRKVDAEGFDGAIVMRSVSETQKLSYTPGMAYPANYGGFYGYYGYGWGMAYSPGYLRTDTIVSVETNVYDLNADDGLVWAGITETFNPSDTAKMAREIAQVVSKQLREEGLID